MKKGSTYFLLFIALVVAVAGCIEKKPGGVKVPRMNPKYGYRDKEPMGGYIAYHYLNSLFTYGVTEVTNKSFGKLRYEISHSNSLYIIVAKAVFVNKKDIESMLNYVGNGNTLFISAEYIDEKLIDTLGADMSMSFGTLFGINEFDAEKKDTWVSIANDPVNKNSKYGMFFVPFDNQFLKYDSSATQVLGYNEKRNPNFIAVDHGPGKFILHTAPATFSNHFLLTGNNREYLEKVFSYLKYETNSVYWDNFYRVRTSTDEDFSIIGFFKKHEALYPAFLLVLLLLLLYLAFGGKRKQRYVPVKIPNTNTTVSYTETIGRLYLQKKNNRNIAVKMFTYFLDQVRNHYYLNTQNLNNEFAEALSRKSGVPEARVKRLLSLMDDADRSDNISDLRLLEIHNLLEEYFKK